MTELVKYSTTQRDQVYRAIDQIADIEGHGVTTVFEEHTTCSVGYLYSNGVREREIFMIDDPTCREPMMVFASNKVHETIKDKVENVAKSS